VGECFDREELMTVTFRAGRAPNDPAKPRVRLASHRRAVGAAPASVDWHSRVGSWPMFANDSVGDCTEANVGHTIQNTSTYGEGQTVTITDADVLAAYSRVSGYDPSQTQPDGSNPTDNGAAMQDVYADWRKNGVGGHRILVSAEVAIANLDEVKQAIDDFGAVGLGITVYQQMMDDFNAGLGFTRAGGANLGGHAVPAVGYDAKGVYVVTWAQVILMTWACFAKVVEEGWVAILPEWFSAAGQDPDGVDLYGLGEEMSSLTGDPNPFPAPSPGPTPQPVPTPTPVPPPVGDADGTLAATARGWVSEHHAGGNKTMATALKTWLAAKNLTGRSM
jgi:hypothetical protein